MIQFLKAQFAVGRVAAEAFKGQMSPSMARANGPRMHGVHLAVWDLEKDEPALIALKTKFLFNGSIVVRPTVGPPITLWRLLFETGEKELVYASPNDPEWSCGFSVEDAPFYEPFWKPNVLGKVLMVLRHFIRHVFFDTLPLEWEVSAEDRAVQESDVAAVFGSEE